MMKHKKCRRCNFSALTKSLKRKTHEGKTAKSKKKHTPSKLITNETKQEDYTNLVVKRVTSDCWPKVPVLFLDII